MNSMVLILSDGCYNRVCASLGDDSAHCSRTVTSYPSLTERTSSVNNLST